MPSWTSSSDSGPLVRYSDASLQTRWALNSMSCLRASRSPARTRRASARSSEALRSRWCVSEASGWPASGVRCAVAWCGVGAHGGSSADPPARWGGRSRSSDWGTERYGPNVAGKGQPPAGDRPLRGLTATPRCGRPRRREHVRGEMQARSWGRRAAQGPSRCASRRKPIPRPDAPSRPASIASCRRQKPDGAHTEPAATTSSTGAPRRASQRARHPVRVDIQATTSLRRRFQPRSRSATARCARRDASAFAGPYYGTTLQ